MIKKLAFIFICLFFLTGCYNYRELNDLAIVSGISVSLVEHEYEVTVEIVNPKKQQDASSSEEPDFIIYKKKDVSLQEAFRKIIEESPKKLYGSHMNILILDESVAKNNLPDILDFFARDPEIRNEFYVLISKNKDVLSVTTPLENISSKNILDSLKTNAKYLGYTNLVTFHDLLNTYLDPYIEPTISSVEIIGNEHQGDNIHNLEKTEREASIVINGVAIFKDNKLIDYLENEDVLAYNLILGNTNDYLIRTDYSNQQYMVNEIVRGKTDMSVDIKKQKIMIKISGRAALTEENINVDLENILSLNQLQEDLNETIQNMIQNSIKKNIKKYHTDIYGFQRAFYHESPYYIKSLKKDWNNEVLEKLQIEVQSNIKIVEKGKLNGGLYHE